MKFAEIIELRVPCEQTGELLTMAKEALAKLGELTPSGLAREAAKVHPSPSEAQQEAGNYQKGHITWKGLDITIETAKGQRRKPEWPPLRHAYGYFKRTLSGADGDHIDVIINDAHLDSEIVFVVNQVKSDGGFDEHKTVIGCISEEEARKTYLANYSKGWKGLGSIKAMTLGRFRSWLEDGDTSKRAADVSTLPYRDRIEMHALKGNQVLGGIYDDDKTHGVFGGGIEPYEDPLEAAAREFHEESGYKVKNPRLIEGIKPYLQEWHQPYDTPEQAERAKKYRGSRTLFATGDLADDEPVPAIDPSHLTDIKLRSLADAIALQHDAVTNPRSAARKAVLEKLLAGVQLPLVSKVADDLDTVECNLEDEKTAADFAAGLPRSKNFGDLSRLESGQLYDFVTQRHDAQKAGPHTDIRFGGPGLGLYSWASRHGLPAQGERRLAVAQPVHRYGYRNFEGTIPEGQYGAGTVTRERSGQILLTKVTPHEIQFTTGDSRYPERFTMVKTHQRQRDWLMLNTTPTELPPEKPHYTTIPAEKVESVLKSLHPGSSVQAKIDGAAHLVKLLQHGVELVSYRPSRVTGGPLFHTERVLGNRLHDLNIPAPLVGSILRAETYGLRGNEAIPPQELGGLLNSGLAKSLQDQRTRGVKMRNLLFDVHRLGKHTVDPDVTPYAERMQMLKEILPHLPAQQFHLPEEATTPEQALQLWKQVTSGQHPLTSEGLVLHPPLGLAAKIKQREEHDVHVHSIFPGEGKYQGTGAGGFYYSHEPGGISAGKVGTGLSDELRRELQQNPHSYLGRLARVSAQERLPSGALRAPSFLAFHEDHDPAAPQSPPTIKLAAAHKKDGSPFTLAVDLDGTLAEAEEPFDPKTIGAPRPKAKKYMLSFRKAGVRLIIFTVRGDTTLVKKWAKKHGIPYDYINENPDQPPHSSGKVFAHAMWDDRAWNALDLDEHGPALLDMAKAHGTKEAMDGMLVTPEELLEALAAT